MLSKTKTTENMKIILNETTHFHNSNTFMILLSERLNTAGAPPFPVHTSVLAADTSSSLTDVLLSLFDSSAPTF